MIAVTGGAGFIGSNIIADLEAVGAGPIAVIDWFGTGDKWRNLAKRSIAAFVDPDQTIEFLTANAAAITAVIHMGAISATTERDVDSLIRLNIRYSVALWDWCAQVQIPFIYASSAATYGARETGFEDGEEPAALAGLQPLNGYGWSKKAIDDIFADRVRRGCPKPAQWVGLKFFNVFGPNEYHKEDMRSVIVKLFDEVSLGKNIRLFKSYRPGITHGDQRRDFIYVKDCSRAVLWFLENPGINGIYNLGTGTARSFLEIGQILLTRLNKRADIEFIEMPDAIRERYQYFTQADTKKIRSAGLQFEFASLETGIEDYLEYYLLRDDRFR